LIEIRIVPEDSQLAELVAGLEIMGSRIMPKTYRAFKMASALIQHTWKCYAMGAPIPGSTMRIKHATGAYAGSIKVRFLSPFNYEIYSDSKIAVFLEKGTKQYDMKETHPFGKRSRVSKEGISYLVIPLRHGTPETKGYPPMPGQVYNKIREIIKRDENLMSTRAAGRKYSPSHRGELVPRAKYQWGARFTGTGFDQLEGMVVMNIPTGKEKGRSAYMTFRVISAENSPAMKWIVKARPAMNITKHVAEETAKEIERIIEFGLKQDLGIV